MHLTGGLVVAIILVLMSPIIWGAWWLLADLGTRANGAYKTEHRMTTVESRRRAA